LSVVIVVSVVVIGCECCYCCEKLFAKLFKCKI